MFDCKCRELADYFFPEDLPGPLSTKMRNELAQHIQDLIEDWLIAEQPRIDALYNLVDIAWGKWGV